MAVYDINFVEVMAVYNINFVEVMAVNQIPCCLFLRQHVKRISTKR